MKVRPQKRSSCIRLHTLVTFEDMIIPLLQISRRSNTYIYIYVLQKQGG